MIKRVYIDTSVVGGQFDKEFSLDTIPFFNLVSKGQFIIIISDLLEAEPLRAPAQFGYEMMSFNYTINRDII